MFVYKDYAYVEHVFNLPFSEGLKLYNLCIGRLNNIIKENNNNKIWDMYLLESQNGFNGSYEEYKDQINIKNNNKELNKDEVKYEFDRIHGNVSKIIEMSKMKRKKNNE